MKYLVVSCCLIFALSCGQLNLFEKITTFNKQEWSGNDIQKFDFQISDTAARYHIYVIIRHSDAYRYNNLWLNVITQAPGQNPATQQLELQLADNKKGWLGTGIDDIFDHRIRITRSPVKLNKGLYQFRLQHTMREEPLQNIWGAGIRVEKL